MSLSSNIYDTNTYTRAREWHRFCLESRSRPPTHLIDILHYGQTQFSYLPDCMRRRLQYGNATPTRGMSISGDRQTDRRSKDSIMRVLDNVF